MRYEFKPRIETITVSQEVVDRLDIGQVYSEGGVVIDKVRLGVQQCYSQSLENCEQCPLKTSCGASLA